MSSLASIFTGKGQATAWPIVAVSISEGAFLAL